MTGAGPGGGGLFNRWATVGLANNRTVRSRWAACSSSRTACGTSTRSVSRTGRRHRWCVAATGRNRATTLRTSRRRSYGFDFYGQYALSNATNWNGNGTTPQGREAGAAAHVHVVAVPDPRHVRRNPQPGKRWAVRSASGTVNTANAAGGVFTASREYTAHVQRVPRPVQDPGRLPGGPYFGACYGLLPGQPTTLDHEWGGVTWQATPAAALIAAVYHVERQQRRAATRRSTRSAVRTTCPSARCWTSRLRRCGTADR